MSGEYGACLREVTPENMVRKARLMAAVGAALTAAPAEAAPSLAIGVRLSPEVYGQAKGIDLDETIQLAEWLADDGIEFLHLSLWRSERMTQKRPDTHATPLFRAAVGNDVRIVVAGGIWTADDALAQLVLDRA